MAGHGTVTVVWGDGERTFSLDLGKIRELQDTCDAGPAWIAGRLLSGQWRVDDVREPIRLGLIGGGASETDAHKLCVRYVDSKPFSASVPIALIVLNGFLHGVGDDPAGESGPAGTPATTSQPNADDGASAPSTVSGL